ncbi:hypothetical protein Hypma_014611, partial [Hypsizygus marmoreus]
MSRFVFGLLSPTFPRLMTLRTASLLTPHFVHSFSAFIRPSFSWILFTPPSSSFRPPPTERHPDHAPAATDILDRQYIRPSSRRRADSRCIRRHPEPPFRRWGVTLAVKYWCGVVLTDLRLGRLVFKE